MDGKQEEQAVRTFDTQEDAERWIVEDTAAAAEGYGELVALDEQRNWGVDYGVCDAKLVVKSVSVGRFHADACRTIYSAGKGWREGIAVGSQGSVKGAGASNCTG